MKLKNYLQHMMRKETGGASGLSRSILEGLHEECGFMSLSLEDPAHIDQAFIVGTYFEDVINPTTQVAELKARVMISTTRMLSFEPSTFYSDSTHNTTLERFNLQTFCGSDINRKTHLLGVMLSTGDAAEDYEYGARLLLEWHHSLAEGTEYVRILQTAHLARQEPVIPPALNARALAWQQKVTAVCADAAEAIVNGIRVVFTFILLRIMCFFHVSKVGGSWHVMMKFFPPYTLSDISLHPEYEGAHARDGRERALRVSRWPQLPVRRVEPSRVPACP